VHQHPYTAADWPQDRRWHVQGTSGTTGEGLLRVPGLMWLVDAMGP
jgi:hypothetical protein